MGRIGAALGADEVRPRPLRPDLQLLLRRGPIGVGRGHDDRPAVLSEPRRELADRRRLARAVDADDEDHGGLVGNVEDRSLAEELGYLLGQRRVQVRELATRLEPPHELGRGADADVAGDERLLELLPVGVVPRVEGGRRRELARERSARLRERVAQPREEPATVLLVGIGRRVRLAQQLPPATRRAATPRCG